MPFAGEDAPTPQMRRGRLTMELGSLLARPLGGLHHLQSHFLRLHCRLGQSRIVVPRGRTSLRRPRLSILLGLGIWHFLLWVLHQGPPSPLALSHSMHRHRPLSAAHARGVAEASKDDIETR